MRYAISGTGPRREKTVKVLVIGPTGRVGSEVVKALLQRGADVRAFTRKQRKAGAFPDAVEVALGDLSYRFSIADAMKDVDKLFLLIGGENVPVELMQALTAYGLAKKSGLKHVTYVSVERGFSNTEDQTARFAALLGHQPRTYSSFAEELAREWTTA